MLAYQPEDRITPTDALREPFMMATATGVSGESGSTSGTAGGSAAPGSLSSEAERSVAPGSPNDVGAKPQKVPKLDEANPFSSEIMDTTDGSGSKKTR